MDTALALSPIVAGTHHLALVAGLPASPTYLAADFCRDLLARQHGTCEVANLNDLNEETVSKVAAISSPLLFLAEIPDAEVAAMAGQAAFPIIVFDQSFVAASYDFMAARDAELLDTVRTTARAQMGMLALADIPRTVVIAIDPEEPASAIVEAAAAALGVPAEVAREVVNTRSLDRPLSEVLDETFAHPPVERTDEADDMLDRLERFYDLQHEGRRVLDAPMTVLVEGVAPHLPATNTIDLLGPARCMTFGPYLYLPAGRWSLRFGFTTAENESGNSLGFDVTADEEIKFVQDYTLTTAGRFEFRCSFDIENPFYPFEFRSHLQRGAIGGRFTLNSLVIEAI